MLYYTVHPLTKKLWDKDCMSLLFINTISYAVHRSIIILYRPNSKDFSNLLYTYIIKVWNSSLGRLKGLLWSWVESRDRYLAVWIWQPHHCNLYRNHKRKHIFTLWPSTHIIKYHTRTIFIHSRAIGLYNRIPYKNIFTHPQGHLLAQYHKLSLSSHSTYNQENYSPTCRTYSVLRK